MVTVSTYLILKVLIAHFVGDFLLQSDEMSKKKSSDSIVLSQHVLIYMGTFFLLLTLLGGASMIGEILAFVAVNGVLHWITDYITSRFTSYYWQEGNIPAFFNTVGLDQCIHGVCLIFTAAFIF